MRGSIKEVHCYPFIIGNFVVTDKIREGVYKVQSYICSLSESSELPSSNEKVEYIIQTTKGSKMLKGSKYLIVARLLTLNRGEGETSALWFKSYIIVKSKISNLVHNSFIPSWEIIRPTSSDLNNGQGSYFYRTEVVRSKFLEVIEVKTSVTKELAETLESGYEGCLLTVLSKTGGTVTADKLETDTKGMLGHWCDVMKLKR